MGVTLIISDEFGDAGSKAIHCPSHKVLSLNARFKVHAPSGKDIIRSTLAVLSQNQFSTEVPSTTAKQLPAAKAKFQNNIVKHSLSQLESCRAYS
jgi:hypothetical protein